MTTTLDGGSLPQRVDRELDREDWRISEFDPLIRGTKFPLLQYPDVAARLKARKCGRPSRH